MVLNAIVYCCRYYCRPQKKNSEWLIATLIKLNWIKHAVQEYKVVMASCPRYSWGLRNSSAWSLVSRAWKSLLFTSMEGWRDDWRVRVCALIHVGDLSSPRLGLQAVKCMSSRSCIASPLLQLNLIQGAAMKQDRQWYYTYTQWHSHHSYNTNPNPSSQDIPPRVSSNWCSFQCTYPNSYTQFYHLTHNPYIRSWLNVK